MVKVAVGIIRQNGNILICQRKRTARYGLKWEFPGGKVEKGETPVDSLKRELKEELAIDADVGTLYHREAYTYPDAGTFDVFYFTIPSYSGTLENRVFEAILWIPERGLEEIDMLEGNGGVVKKLLNEKGGDA